MRGDVDLAELGHGVPGVDALIASQRDLLGAVRMRLHQMQCRQSLGMSGGASGDQSDDDQAIHVLHHQTYYGLRLHLRVAGPGVITAATLAPANDDDRAVAPQMLAGLSGWALGDGGYWSPKLRPELATDGVNLLAPPRGKTAGATRWPAWIVQTRRRIETVLSQLTERHNAKQTRARDHWHLLSRWARKFLSHTIAVLCCQRAGLAPLAFAQLVQT